MAQPQFILHHYPRSPFSEKIRLAFGVKRLTWHSVVQPRYAPKPELVPLTGGYRRTPVMQIGSDIYCDTCCILAELDRRRPEPALLADGNSPLANMLAAFADRALFAEALGLVFGLHGDRFSDALHADRARLMAGRYDAWDTARMKAKMPSLQWHFQCHLGWVDGLLGDGRSYLLGKAPSIADLAVYHPLWYARENLEAERVGWHNYPNIARWMERIAAIGHGEAKELAPQAALAIARDTVPAPIAPAEPLAHALIGRRVTVTPDDWGFDPVAGELAALEVNRISLRRHDDDVGSIMINFPQIGFVLRDVGDAVQR